MWHMGEHSSLAVFQVIETFDPKKTTVDAYMEDIRANVVAHLSRDTFYLVVAIPQHTRPGRAVPQR